LVKEANPGVVFKQTQCQDMPTSRMKLGQNGTVSFSI